jgi:hypothetical protein
MRTLGFSLFTCLISSMPPLPGIDTSSSRTSKSVSRAYLQRFVAVARLAHDLEITLRG